MSVAIHKVDGQYPREAEKNAGQGISPKDPNPAAQRAASDLLNRLYDHGILDLVRALASGGVDTVTRIAQGVNTPQSLRAMKNALAVLSILSSLDPNLLERIAKSVSQDPTRGRVADHEPPGLWSIVKRFTSRDSRRALGAIAAGLESVGRALDAEADKL